VTRVFFRVKSEKVIQVYLDIIGKYALYFPCHHDMPVLRLWMEEKASIYSQLSIFRGNGGEEGHG
jgi:hypothetical protein